MNVNEHPNNKLENKNEFIDDTFYDNRIHDTNMNANTQIEDVKSEKLLTYKSEINSLQTKNLKLDKADSSQNQIKDKSDNKCVDNLLDGNRNDYTELNVNTRSEHMKSETGNVENNSDCDVAEQLSTDILKIYSLTSENENEETKNVKSDKLSLDKEDASQTEIEHKTDNKILKSIDRPREIVPDKNKTHFINRRISKQLFESLDTGAIGLQNPQAYCYLNSILHALYSFDDLKNMLIKYYETNKASNADNTCASFTNDLGQLFYNMKKKHNDGVQESVKSFQRHFVNSSNGDDIHNCYLKIVNNIKLEISKEKSSGEINEVESKFIEHNFIKENLTGKMSYHIQCESCNTVLHKTFQDFLALPLPVPLSKERIPFQRCFSEFLWKSQVIGEELKCCVNSKIFSFTELESLPKYLFIYMTRGSYFSTQDKNETFVDFTYRICIPTLKEIVNYKVKSVIDHIGGNESGHYFVKVHSGLSWWLKNDFHVRKISCEDMCTKHSIGFFLEKETDWFIDNGTQWIIQILFSCDDFRKQLACLYSYLQDSSKINSDELVVMKLYEIIRKSEKNEINEARKLMKNLEKIFSDNAEKFKDNIERCYLHILNSVYNVAKQLINKQIGSTENDDETRERNYKENEDLNIDLLSDPFLGYMVHQGVCEKCGKVSIENFEEFRSIPLQINHQKVNLQNSINLYLSNSWLNNQGHHYCCGSKIVYKKEITNPPKYLFIYFTQNSNELNNCNNRLEISTKNDKISYKVISVIDYIRRDNTTNYLLKTLSNGSWSFYHETDSHVIPWAHVFTQNTCGLFLKMKSSSGYRPNSLFNSIIQMLYFCEEFQFQLVNFYTNPNGRSKLSDGEVFLSKLSQIMYYMQAGEINQVQKLINDLQMSLPNISENLLSCYHEILERVESKQIIDTSLFTGSVNFYIICEHCSRVFDRRSKLFKVIRLPLTKNVESIQKCINRIFFVSEASNKYCQYCHHSRFIRNLEIYSSPKYLFFLLIRKPDSKNVLTLEREITLPTVSGMKFYSLKSIMSKADNVDCGEYFITVYNETLKLYDDFKSHDVSEVDLVPEDIMGFMMELKESNIDTGVNSFDHSNNHMENKINDDSSMDIKINKKSVEEKFSNIQNNIVHAVDVVEDKTNIIFSQGNKDFLPIDMDNCSNGIFTSILDDIISDICNELNKNNNDVQNEIINPCPVNAEFIINETIAKSIGIILENSVNSKSYFSVIAMLFACPVFIQHMLEVHKKDMITKLDLELYPAQDVFFVDNMCQLVVFIINGDHKKIMDSISNISRNVLDSSNINNLFEYYSFLLEKIYSVIQVFSRNIESLSDLFFAQKCCTVYCENCSKIHQNLTQKMAGISLPVSSLSWCVRNTLCTRDHKGNDFVCCETPRIISKCSLSRTPQFIFFHLFAIDDDQNIEPILLEGNEEVTIPYDNRNIVYSPCAVIQIGKGKSNTNIFFKNSSMNHWWKITSFGAEQIFEMPSFSGFEIGVMLRKRF